jgi:hypothetical protein
VQVAEAVHLPALWAWYPEMHCSLELDIFQPSWIIRLAAHKFIAERLGLEYAAFHMRRGDIVDHIMIDDDPGVL